MPPTSSRSSGACESSQPSTADPAATSISDAEAQVMALLWDHAPQSADALAGTLRTHQGWQPSTVKTLLARLVAKQAVTADKDGRRFLYTPRLARHDWLTAQSTVLVDRLFGGRVSALVSHFASERPLKPADLAALRRLLAEYDEDQAP